MKRLEVVVLAVLAALSQTGCFTSWVASQAGGNAKIWDENVREQSVPMPDFTEHLVVAMPLVIEMTPAPATTTRTSTMPAPAPTPLPFALQCRAKQQGQDAVYHSAFRYGKSWKKGTAIMFLLEGLGAAALVFGGLEDDKAGNVVLGGLLAIDAVGTGALFFAPRKDVYRREVKPVITTIREDCPETLTLQIGSDTFPADAIGRLGELGDLALDDWMQAPAGALLLGFEGRSFELVITAADRCTWNRHRQRSADPSCTYAGISQQYVTKVIDVTPGTLTPRHQMNAIPDLDAALLRQLHLRFQHENTSRFGGRLCAPVFSLSAAATRLGAWISRTRTLELSRDLVYARPWPEVTDVLIHEMAHQYVDEILQVKEETAHGDTFRRVCEERGIDARAAGFPAGTTTAGVEADRVLERVRKLLALAGSPNQHEAEMAMRRAHELMLRHNIESAQTRAAVAFELRHLGDPTRRTSRVESEVVGLLARYFFVRAIRIPVYLARTAGHGWVFELAGTLPNVEMAVHVHGFLLATAARLWEENKGDRRVRSGRDRLSYQTGVIRGFHDKLALERLQLRGTGLVWVGDARLDDFYRARNPRVTRRRTSIRLTGAHQAGREAGQKIVIHRPIESSGDGSASDRKRLRA